MTVAENSNPINSSTANGVTTVFPYEFTVLDDEDITVAVEGVVQTSGYTVTGVGGSGGGTVVFTTAPANGALVVRYLDPALKRETDYQQFGDWLADEVNRDFDRLWLAIQGANNRIDASLHVSLSAHQNGLDTELPAPQGGTALGWAADGLSLINIILSTGTTLVNLAASTGATLIGFLHSAIGSVLRTVQSKLADTYSTADAGIVSSGSLDQTVELQAFFDAVTTNGLDADFPWSTVMISSPVTINIGSVGFRIRGIPGSSIIGVLSGFAGTAAVKIVSAGAPIQWEISGINVQNAGSSCPIGMQIGDPTGTTVMVGYTWSHMSDIHITGFATLYDIVNIRLIHFQRLSGWTTGFGAACTCVKIRHNTKFVSDLIFNACNFVTDSLAGRTVLSIDSSGTTYNPATGVGSIGGLTFIDCDFYAGDKCVNITCSGTSYLADIWFIRCQIDQQTTYGMYIEASGASSNIGGIFILSGWFNKSTSPQVSIAGISGGIVRGVTIRDHRHLNGVSAGIAVYGDVSVVKILDGVFEDHDYPTGRCIEFNGDGTSGYPKKLTVTGNTVVRGPSNKFPANLVTINSGCSDYTITENDGNGVVSGALIQDLGGDVVKTVENNTGYNPLGLSTITVTASPFTWKNTTGAAVRVLLNGGTVSAITLDGGNVPYDANGTYIAMGNRHSVTVTYTVAPNMNYTGI